MGFARSFRRQMKRREVAARKQRRKIVFEPLEPRLLLSADGVISGITDAVVDNLETVGDSLLAVVDSDTNFDIPIPGVLQDTHDVNGDTLDDGIPNGKLNDKDVHVPTVRDTLSLNVNRDGSLDGDLNETLSSLVLPVDKSNLQDVYEYVDGQKLLGLFSPTDEQALRAMDLNSASTEDNIVDWQEMYDVLVVGAISDFLNDYGSLGKNVGDLQSDFAAFLNTLHEPSSVNSLIDLDLSGVTNHSDADHFSFSFTVNLTVKDQYLIDLGLEADRNEILLPATTFTPGSPSTNPGLADVPPEHRTVELDGSIALPFKFTLDIPVADFRFAVPTPITVAVDDAVAGSGGESLQSTIVNVGFLGTEVPGPASDSKFNLHMDWHITVTDPSSPTNLGFTQALPTTSTSGVLTAATALPNDPGTPFVFPHNGAGDLNVIFDLTVGQQSESPEAIVTVLADSTEGNTTADDLRADVQTALNSAGLGIVTASLTGSDQLRLSLPSGLDITPLGYAGNQLFNDAADPLNSQLDAPNAPSILGHTAVDTIRFLLSVGGAIPTLVTVTTTPGDDDPDGIPGNADDGQLSIAGLIADLNIALPAGVSATNVGGRIRIFETNSDSLEVTRTIKLDARDEITLAEFNHPSFSEEFVVPAGDTSDDVLNIVMPLNVRQGLDFGPAGSPGIKVDIEPFNFSDASLTPDASFVKRLALPLMNLDGPAVAIDNEAGGSNFIQYLDFNAVGPGEAIGMIQQLENWLTKLRNTEMLGNFNIPFSEAVLGNLLAFEDLIHDTLLIDDNDTTDDDADDKGRLLAKIAKIDPDAFVAAFGTAQELGARLDQLFSQSILTRVDHTVRDDDGQGDDDYAAYDEATKQLTYQISLSHLFAADNVGVDFASNIDLAPIGEISTQSKVHLEATGHFDAVLGIELGPGKIEATTPLASLNGGLGAGIATGIAFTGAGDVRVVEGRLSADATFDVSVTTGSGTTTARVTVTRASTAENTQIGHLLTDIDTALQNAKLLPLPAPSTPPTTVDISDRLQAISELGRIILKAVDGAGVQHFSVNTSTGNASYTELGLPTTVATTVFLDVEPENVKVSSDVVLNIFKNNDATSTDITLQSGTSGIAATGGNNTLTDLVNDINEALAATGLHGKIAAARSGNKLALVGIDGEIESINVSSSSGPAGEIGFGSAQVAGVFMVAPNDLGTPLTPPNNTINVFGQLSADAKFSIALNGGAAVEVTILKTATDNNTSLDMKPKVVNADELIDDINAAIAATSLAGKVKAFQADNLRIGFRATDDEVKRFDVTAVGGDPAVTEMGLLAGTQTADASLRVVAIKDAPFFFGPATDATFNVTVAGGTSAVTDLEVTVRTSETLTNSTIQDLVGDVRRALDAAFGSVAANPLLVSSDGNRILLKPKSTGAGAGVTAFSISAAIADTAVTDLNLYQAGASLAGPNVTSSADTADLLIYTQDNNVTRVTLDGDTTVGDVLADIDPDGAGVGVDAAINDIAAGLKLNDHTTAAATDPQLFRVDSVNGSHAAQALGIFGADTDVNHPTIDHQIDGTRIATLQLANRFFLRQVDASTDILSADVTVGAATFNGSSGSVVTGNQIKITEHGFASGDAVVYNNNGADSSVSGLTSGATYYIINVNRDTIKLASTEENAQAGTALTISAAGTGTTHRLQSVLLLEAAFGFVGVKLTGSGAASGSLGIGFSDEYNDPDDAVPIADLLEALSKDQDADGDVDVFDLNKFVDFPSLSLTGDLVFGVEVYPSLSMVGLGTTPTITFHLNGPGNPFLLKAGATAPYDLSDLVANDLTHPSFTSTLPDVNVTSTDLDSLANFTDVEFGDILSALEGLSDFLSQFAALSFLNEEIPFIGVSFNELVDIAERFETAVTDIVQNPSGAVQSLEQKIRETFGLPAGSSVFGLSLVDNDDGDGSSTDMLKVKLNLSKAFSEALMVDLDLGDQLPGVSLLGSAGLNASGSLAALLTFGVNLDNPTDLYLFTHESETGITANFAATADNLTFNAALGPVGIFITGGDVDFSLSGSFKTSGGAAGDKASLTTLLSDLESAGFTPTFNGSVEAVLPVFFPTQSTFKGDIEFRASLSLGPAPDYDLDFTTDLEVPPDILNIDFSQFNLFDSVILAVDTFDTFLSGIQDLLDGEIFGIELPLIGDKLSEGAEFINDMRTGVIQPLRELVETAQTQGTSIVQTFLFDLLGPGSQDGTIPGLGLLLDPTDLDGAGNPTPATSSDRSHIDDIVQKSENLTGPISQSFAQWNFLVGQVYTPPLDFDIDLGLPGLSLDLEGNLIFSLGWSLGFGFGVSIRDGAYIEILRTNSDDPLSHTFPNSADGAQTTFENISPRNSDLDANGSPNGASGGRINGMASVAGTNQVFYAASEFGGIYKTTDGGDTWVLLENHLPQVTWDVEVDPVTTSRVYATSFYDGRINSIAGINVSNDSGATWTHPASAVPVTDGSPGDNTPQEGFSVDPVRVSEPSAYGISIRPDAPANVVIGTNAGVAISDDSGASWQFFNPYRADVFFDTDSFDLTDKPATIPTLDAFVPIIQKYLADNPTYRVEVAGYTDTVGGASSNQTLSDNRADAVRDYLVTQGIDTNRIDIIGFGEQAAHLAVDTGDGDDTGPGTAEQANRRTEIHLQAVDVYDVVCQSGGIIDVVGALGHARSTDGGTTWAIPHLLPGNVAAISIDASPDEDYVLFAVSTSNGLYESDNAGANWTLLGSDVSPQGRIPFVTVNDRSGNGGRDFDIWYGDTELFRIPARSPAVLAQGGTIRAFPGGLPLFSSDGVDNDGDNPAAIDEPNEWWMQNPANLRAPVESHSGAHADVGDVVFDRTMANDAVPKLYSNDGGVYRNTANAQAPSWEQPSVTPHALYIMGFAGVDQPGNDDEDLYFVLQDDGVWALQKAGAANPAQLSPAEGGWHNSASADGFDIAADDDRVIFNNGVFGTPGRRERAFLGPRGLPGFETTPQLGNYPTGAVIDFKHSEAYDTWGNDKFAMLTGDNNAFGDNTFGDGGLFITTNIKSGPIVWNEVNNAGEPNSAQFADLQAAIDGSGNPTFYVTVGSGSGITADALWKVTGVSADGSGTATAVWTRIDTNIAGATGVSIFTVDSSNPNRLYAAAVMAGNQPQIWRSNDGGVSWTQDTELDGYMVNPDQAGGDDFQYRNQRGPADFPFNAGTPQANQGLTGYPQPTLLAFDPEDPNVIVAGGADSGLFLSRDDGANWELLTDPLGTDADVPHIPRPRDVHFDHEGGVLSIFVASQGGGIWRVKVDIPTQTGIVADAGVEPANNTSGGAETLVSVPAFDNDLGVDNRSIHTAGDIDYYKFTATHTGNAIVNLYFDNLFGDLNLTLEDSGGGNIGTGEQGNLKDHLDVERAILTVTEGQTYYIKVSGASPTTGYYDLVVEKSVPELDLFIEAGIGTGSTLVGTLGFLQLEATASESNFDADGDPDPTRIRADFTIDIFNGDNPGDTRLSLSELGSVDAVIGLTADAEVNLDLVLGLSDDLLPDTIAAAIPTVRSKFLLDWSVGGPITDFSFEDGLKLVEFRDLGLDLGSFLGDTVGPIVDKIQEITEPLQPIVDIVTARIPVLSDLAGRTITLADIAAAFGEFDPGLIYAVADIISLVNSIDAGAGQSLFLEFGDFKIVDVANPGQALMGGNGGFLTNPNLDFSDGSLGTLGIPDFSSKLDDMRSAAGLPSLGDLTDLGNGILDGLLAGDSGEPAATTTKSMFSGGFSSTPDDSGFAFPIFEKPSQIFGLLLGRNATIITYDLPPFLMDFKWEVSFPIYPPLNGVVAAGIGMKIDLAFGYDTEGIRQFASGDFQNPLDLIAGFFVSDTNMPDGSFGVDVPELSFTGSIGVGAELNLGIASAGVTADIILSVDFDLYDPDRDGKVRISEMVSTFLFEARNGNPALAPISIFDVSGDIAFQLSAFIKFLFLKLDFEITPPIVLFEFKIPFDREPILATERGDGSVLLNIGSNAAARQNGDARDIAEEIHVKDGGSGKVAVWSDQYGVPESAAQLYSIGSGKPVVAFGGEGDDIIDVSKLTSIGAELEGGSGNDILTGGAGKDILKGGIGDDQLFGTAGDDVIYGGEGNDTIDGGIDADIIFGDTGSINSSGDIRSAIGLKDGEDTITGGLGADIIIGGGADDDIGGDVAYSTLDGGGDTDNDFIFGDGASIGATAGGLPDFTKVTNSDGTVTFTKVALTDRNGGGKDTIRGHGGLDVIFGGSGDDDIDGGAQNDTIFGESGLDLISGGGHADTIMGGTEDDRIFGFRDEGYPGDTSDGRDTIFGQAGNDFIRGNQDNDTIEGNAGADVIFGDYGNDNIFGNNEPDLIFGGPDRDTIDGGAGNDIIFGDDGFVVWVNFFDPDIDDATDTPDDHRAIGFIGGDADIFDNLWNPAITDAQLDALDADIRADADAKVKTLDLIKTLVNTTDGNDRITGGEGDDIVLGGADDLFSGVKGDTIFGDFDPGTAPGTPPEGDIPAGADILIGDGGRIQFDDRRRDNVRTIPGTSATEVGDDTISGNGGSDLIFGGGAADTLYGRMPAVYTNPLLEEDASVSDNDVIIGDDGEIQYETLGLNIPEPFIPVPGEEIEKEESKESLVGARAVYVFIRTEELDTDALTWGGIDHAFGNRGDDIIFGGVAGDVLKGDDGADGDDIIFGDNGQIDFGLDDDGISTKITELYTTDTLETTGGADTIEGQDNDDIILGGVNNGAPDVIYGDRATPTVASIAADGHDIILGDNGKIRFNVDTDLDTLDFITSEQLGLGGADTISGNRGDDVLIGSTGGDTMYGDDTTASAGVDDGEDIMLGDNGDITLIGTAGRLIVRHTAVDLIEATDILETTGGADTMSGNARADIMLGGVNDGGIDTMYGDRAAPNPTTIANDSDDVLLGDNGLLDFTYDTDTDRYTLDLIRAAEDGRGGTDLISGNRGLDVAIGGTGDDTIYGDDLAASAGADDLADILLGDNADIFLVAKGAAAGGDLKTVLDAAVKTIRTTDEEHPEYGGIDTISGNASGDIIAGGVKGDTLYGDASSVVPTLDGDDIILGDNGAFEWLSNGRLSEIVGIDINANNPALYAKYSDPLVFDTELTTLDLITTEQPTSGGRDTIYGDEANDLVFGGTDLDVIHGDDGNEVAETASANRDVLFGDHGRLYPQFSTLENFNSRNFFAIAIGDTDGGEGDLMWGEEGDDSMLGQQGDDRMWGGSEDDDMTGGHNVAGGYDELTTPDVIATLNPPVNDLMDGGSGDDAMAGDNAIVWRRGDDLSPRFRMLTEDAIYTTSVDGVPPEIFTNVGTDNQSDPDDAVGRDIQLVDHSDAVQDDAMGRFGADVMAGGADSDVMYGQLGDDLMQGDGSIDEADDGLAQFVTRVIDVTDAGINPDTDDTLYFNIPEQVSDADDYMEGNGGSDLMYGGLGQDDIIGGSSELFGLDDANAALLSVDAEELRPDGSDIIFGGAGVPDRLVRNDFVGATDTDEGTAEGVGAVPTDDDPSIAIEDRHSRDADFIMGDNANVFRLVEGGASGIDPDDVNDVFLEFNYDQSSAFEDRGDERIVPRVMEQLDYTLGGADYHGGTYAGGAAQLTGQPADNGAGDLIHGESGDDYIFGMTGSDVIFGESDDDDIIGGYGNDWVSGGTGQDGILGDDGLLLTSRNSEAGEPLYGISGLLATDESTKYNNGNALGETISTPGDMQYAVINMEGQLKKTVDLVPFSLDPDWFGLDDEFPDDDTNMPFADDIIFGGLGSDWLHGGSGDDAISGAEALEQAYVPTFDGDGNPNGVLDLGYSAFDLEPPVNPGDSVANPNPGNVLAFNPVDLDGQHLNNRFRAGEFFLYDEYDPLRKILLNPDGTLNKDTTGVEFLLNFDQSEGIFRPEGEVPKATGQQTETYPAVNDDGKDAIFGDLGNDWLVGGSGRDNLYGGWGNDLINADDDLTTLGDAPKHGDPMVEGANDLPDTHPYYEDRAYGGAGRDILIANTGGDRLIDWVGEYNSYLVPYAPFGQASVSRTLMPHLQEFLYALSAGDGADPTRFADAIGGDEPEPTNNNPIPSRNGEPHGELGLVLQKDFAWQDQTGAPADPQAGNIPGGPRDVLRTAGFNDGTMQGFFVDSGDWAVENGVLKVSAESQGGDAAAVFHVDEMWPGYFEIQASITMEKPTGGWKANSYVIFDYYGPEDFKFAGLNASIDKIQMGHRDATGWHVDVQDNMKIKPGIFYNMLVAVNGTNVTVVVDNQEFFSHTFAPRVDEDGWVYGINDGMVGFGSDNSRGVYDNIAVKVLPPAITLESTEEFPNTSGAIDFTTKTGLWTDNNGRYEGTPLNGDSMAISLVDLGIGRGLAVASVLEFEVTLNTEDSGGVVFDYYGADTFKFAAIDAAADRIMIGHHTQNSGWVADAFYDLAIDAGIDYTLQLSLKGTTVTVSLKEVGAQNWQGMVGHVFNAVTVDGSFGLISKDGLSSFDAVTVKTNDPAFADPDDASFLMAASSPTDPDEVISDLTYDDLEPIIEAAVNRWIGSSLFDESMLSRLDGVTFLIADLTGDALALAVGDTVIIDVDAAAHGWFIDDTPYQDAEYMPQGNDEELAAKEGGSASDDMDLLTVMMHEFGHIFGYQDMDPETNDAEIMNETLDEGVRYLPEGTFNEQATDNSDSLISMDMTPDDSAADRALGDLVNDNPWLAGYLVDGAREDTNPNDDIALIIDDEDSPDPGRGKKK